MYHDGPIIACSTPRIENSALGVIRLSGIDQLELLQNNFSKNLLKIIPKRMYRSDLLSLNGEKIDDILFCYFSNRESYTGENLLELYVHGNQINIDTIIELFLESGKASLAAAGEFSYRAFKNKKMTLSQVEGLGQILNARSGFELREGHQVLSGELNDSYRDLYDTYLKLKMSIELDLEFSEDVSDEEGQRQFAASWKGLIALLSQLKERCELPSETFILPRIVLFGPPNAGKSTLFNFMLGRERAMTDSEAGTTRDYIAERLGLGGTSFELIDTAGLRDNPDTKIEQRGIEISKTLSKGAFFRILVLSLQEKEAIFEDLPLADSFDYVVYTHVDLSDGLMKKVSKYKYLPSLFLNLSGAGPIGPVPGVMAPGPMGPVSSEQKDGKRISGPIGPLIRSVLKKYQDLLEKKPILIDRQRELIVNAFNASSHISEYLESGSEKVLVSSDLEIVGHYLGELIGFVAPDEVLDKIFSGFCIGK